MVENRYVERFLELGLATQAAVAVVGLLMLTVGVVVISGDIPGLTASVAGSPGSQGSNPDGAAGLKMGAMVDSCSTDRYDGCIRDQYTYSDAGVAVQLEYDHLKVVHSTSDAYYVDEDAELDYNCDVPAGDGYAWKRDGYGRTDIDASYSGLSAPYTRISTGSGTLSAQDMAGNNGLQIICAGHDATSSAWTAGWLWVQWKKPVKIAEDSDNDGVYDFNDEFPHDPDCVEDSDGDGVCDNNDAFPNDPSETEDSDGDGVGDNADEFPHDPDCVEDSDNDGVCDNKDAFPDNPEYQDDSDGDGVADRIDDCPNQAGQEQYNGCPDTDNDGIPDPDDVCPDEAGKGFGIDSTGCPIEDSDGDGVPDPDDDCQGTPDGVSVDSTGCAVDSDDDGVADYEDACPQQGASEHGLTPNGCPAQDHDLDGVPNYNDACPQTYGSQDDGCPTRTDAIINFIESLGIPLR